MRPPLFSIALAQPPVCDLANHVCVARPAETWNVAEGPLIDIVAGAFDRCRPALTRDRLTATIRATRAITPRL
jgi:hypothetical protein